MASLSKNCLLIVGSVGLLVFAGCGSKSSSVETQVTPVVEVASTVPGAAPTTVATSKTLAVGETRLTTAQASTFSRVLVKNNQDGGAAFTATIPYGVAATFTLTGEIDWKNYDAKALLTTKRSDNKAQAPQQMFWSKGQLVQPIAGLSEAMAAKGRPGIEYLRRPIDAKAAPIDRVIVLINSMSNTRAENPILLRQRDDVAFVGTATLNGTSYSRFRYGSTTYWADATGGLGKVEAVFKTFAGPVEIVFTKKGPRTIALPAEASIVVSTEIPDVLAALTKTSIAAHG